jgi:hypothetical protein
MQHSEAHRFAVPTLPTPAGFTLQEVMKLNHNMDPNNLKEGQTITLPIGKLSERDRQILDGMRAGNYRTYPVRKGEKLDDILAKRKITMEEWKALNPDINPKSVKGVCLPLVTYATAPCFRPLPQHIKWVDRSQKYCSCQGVSWMSPNDEK